MRMRSIRWMMLMIWLPAAGAVAQGLSAADDPNEVPVRLEDYLRYAAMQNSGLRAAFEQWRMAVLAVEPAGALEDPRFSYGYFIEEVETRVGPQKHRLSFSQAFPWFGTLEAREDAAAATARAAGKRYEARKLELFEQTKEVFYEYAYLGRALAIARENLELLKYFEEVARGRYRTAAAGHPDVIRAQIELAVLEDQVRQLEDLRGPLTARINAVLNRPEAEPLPWPVWEDRTPPVVDLTALPEAVEVNPELEAMEFETAAARRQVELAEKRYYPNIMLGVDWIMTDEARMPNVWGSGRDPIVAMLTINLPIWTESYRALEHRAWAQVRQTDRAREQAAYNLEAEIAQAVYELKDSLRKINLHREVLIPKTRQMIAASEEAYRTGALDFLSLVDSQRKLLAYELALERALASHFQQLARLERLLGGTANQIKDQK